MLAEVRITLGLSPSIEVDGEDITDKVAFVGFAVEPGVTIPVIQLGMKGEFTLEGQAEVDVLRDPGASEVVLAFLESLDPQAIYDKAMEDEDLDGKGGVVGAVLRVMKERARHGT